MNWPVAGAFFNKRTYLGASLEVVKQPPRMIKQVTALATIEGYYYNGRSQLNGKMIQTSDGKNIETSLSTLKPVLQARRLSLQKWC